MFPSDKPYRTISRTKIVYDREYEEFIVKAYDQHGRRFEDADYCTNDKADAIATAELMKKPRPK